MYTVYYMSGCMKTVPNFWQNFRARRPLPRLKKQGGGGRGRLLHQGGLGQIALLPGYRLIPSGVPRP